jgi:predicted RNA binding protein with dsRBD fold (UPF0201 family)
VATRGVVVFCEGEGESPLGALTVTMETADVDRLIDWLAPYAERLSGSFRKR